MFYWFILFFVTMKRQIMHMIKYRYVPFSFGKKVSWRRFFVACVGTLYAPHLGCV